MRGAGERGKEGEKLGREMEGKLENSPKDTDKGKQTSCSVQNVLVLCALLCVAHVDLYTKPEKFEV